MMSISSLGESIMMKLRESLSAKLVRLAEVVNSMKIFLLFFRCEKAGLLKFVSKLIIFSDQSVLELLVLMIILLYFLARLSKQSLHVVSLLL
jgi:hypothetical protein